nr:Gag-Pol polyprotein [Tanacetum cinerariifolium]
MKAILRKDKCLAAITERPAEVTDDSKWDEMDGNAIANLHLALADGVLSSNEEKKTAKDIWDHLARLYEARSLHNKIFLKRKLYALRMTESTSVTEHVNNLNTLFSQLTFLDCKIDVQRAEILLQSLPNSYDQVVINLTNNVLTDCLVFDDAAASILEEENRCNNKEDRKTSSKQGHFKKDCRGSNTSNPQGNVASTSDDGNALCCEAAVADEGRKIFADVWVFDTGATFHMTARREWFHQYKPISEGGSMYNCNDHKLKVIGIRSIMVKMHDGTVRTIWDVRYMKGLKKNLLSLGQLDDLSCKLKGETMKEAEASVTLHSLSHKVVISWHQKVGHMSEQGMKILVDRKLLPGLTKVSLPFCEYCVINKQHRLKFKASNSKSVSVLELVYSDVYPIKKKSDVFEVFKVYKARVELDYGKKIKYLRTDNRGEYTERMNRTLLERARAMLGTTSLGKSFWAEAVNTACYVINSSPSTAVELKTPMEMWTGKPIKYLNLHIFCIPVYVMYNSQETTKLDLKSRKCLFLGYTDGVKGYRLWDPTAHKVVISRDVAFMEDEIQENEEGVSTTRETTTIQMEKEFQSNDSSEAVPQHEVNEMTESQAPTTCTLDRKRRRLGWQADYVMESNVAYCLLTEDEKPSTLQEALNNLDASFWKEAMQEKIEALHKNKTWELVPLPGGRKPIGNKWVYKIKRNDDDQVERSLEYNRLHADPCAYFKRFKNNDFIILLLYVDDMLVAGPNKDCINKLKAQLAREFEMKDLAPANKILEMQNHEIEPDIAHVVGVVSRYMAEPGREPWEAMKRILRYIKGTLNVALCYGKEAVWLKMLLEELGYKQEKITLFYDNQSALYLAGNLAFHSKTKRPNKDCINKLKAQLAREFEMKDLRPANKILGMQIHRDRVSRKIWLSQKSYWKKILQRFNMQDCKPISISFPTDVKLSSKMSPNIAHAVGVVSRYMAEPGTGHWEAVKRILRYVKGTSDVALCFGDSDLIVTGYVDSDYASDLDGSKSTTGYMFTLSGGTVSWVSKLKSLVAMSTTEAEYSAQASKEAVWLKMLLKELGYKQKKITLFCDNQSALYLAKNPAFHSKTKHI